MNKNTVCRHFMAKWVYCDSTFWIISLFNGSQIFVFSHFFVYIFLHQDDLCIIQTAVCPLMTFFFDPRLEV